MSFFMLVGFVGFNYKLVHRKRSSPSDSRTRISQKESFRHGRSRISRIKALVVPTIVRVAGTKEEVSQTSIVMLSCRIVAIVDHAVLSRETQRRKRASLRNNGRVN